MEVTRVWVHFFDDSAVEHEQHIVDALSSSLVVDHSRQPPGDGWPGIIVFSAISSALRDLIRESTCNGTGRVIVVAAPGIALRPGTGWGLLHDGAADVLAWDDIPDPGKSIRERFERWSAVDGIVDSFLAQGTLGGTSAIWRSTLCEIVEVASFTNASVLIFGETGTGKEHIARLIHDLDRRPKKRELVLVDCTTIVPELSGSEFFGHERGAFTGATAARDGAFALADGGTLFLDEVGELPLPLQAQLLRAIQEHTYKRVGGNVWHKTQFRLVCATNRDLRREIQSGRFRSDLYYRIATWECRLPSLRERPEDILPLVQKFVSDFHPARATWDIEPSVLHYLRTRCYPGNIRELKQLMARIYCRHVGPGPITAGDIPHNDRPREEEMANGWPNRSLERAVRRALNLGITLKTIRREVEEAAIRVAVHEASGNLQQGAFKLGITDRALQLRIAGRRKTEQTRYVHSE
jgi:transcriptional regulator with GAF, ATPase, and Fis domain